MSEHAAASAVALFIASPFDELLAGTVVGITVTPEIGAAAAVVSLGAGVAGWWWNRRE